MNQCRKPSGPLGWLVLRLMNASHSKVTDWGLSHVHIRSDDTVLDVGCGGGRTVRKLAALAPNGKIYGVDHSCSAVAAATKFNESAARGGRVEIVEGSVSHLPFADDFFDVVTAVETHFWWPDLRGDMLQVFRVLKPGGTFVVIAEVYGGSSSPASQLVERHSNCTGLKVLSVEEHRHLLEGAGFHNVEIITAAARGWICCISRKSE